MNCLNSVFIYNFSALCPWSDFEIYREFCQTMEDETNFIDAIKRMLNETTNSHNLRKQQDALEFIGSNFRIMYLTAPWKSNVHVGMKFLEKVCMIHLDDPIDKVKYDKFA